MKTHGITRAIPASALALTLALASTPAANAASSTDTFKQAAQADGYTTLDVSAADCYTNVFNDIVKTESDVISCAGAMTSDETFEAFYATFNDAGMKELSDTLNTAVNAGLDTMTRRTDGGYDIGASFWLDGNNVLMVVENNGVASDKGANFARQVGMPLTDGAKTGGTASPSASPKASTTPTASPSASATASPSGDTKDTTASATSATDHRPLLIGIGAAVIVAVIAIVTAVILSARKRRTRPASPTPNPYGAAPYGATPGATPPAYADPYAVIDPVPHEPNATPTQPAADPWNQNPQPVTYPTTPDTSGYANPSDSIWNQPTGTLPDTPRQNNTIYRN